MSETIILYDEIEGIDKEFILLATFGMDDNEYCALTEDGDNVMFFMMQETDDGEMVLIGVEDDEIEDLIEVYEELVKDSLD